MDELMRAHPNWLVAAGVGALLFCLLLFGYRRWQKNADMRTINKAFRQAGAEVLNEAVISDGADGYLFADHVLRLPDRIVVLNVLHRRGYVFGDPDLDEWTCVFDKRSEKFANPLRRVTLFAQLARHALGFDAVEGHVLFGSESLFPKGIPQGVWRIEDLAEKLGTGGVADTAVQQAWNRLMQITAEDRRQLNQALED